MVDVVINVETSEDRTTVFVLLATNWIKQERYVIKVSRCVSIFFIFQLIDNAVTKEKMLSSLFLIICQVLRATHGFLFHFRNILR